VEGAGVDVDVDVRFVEMDLTDFESVKRAAREVLAGCERLDVLMLNAGIVGLPHSTLSSVALGQRRRELKASS
jgi:NAD(P)-dependent dehydrogenase (short-subunit alcohol dehydrogenase family)